MSWKSVDPVEVGLLQISERYKGQYYLPYTVGLLQAYVQHHAIDPARYQFRLPVFARLPVAEALTHLNGCQILAFSLYVWNRYLSLAIAQTIKLQAPHTFIIFGGPQVPDHAERFLRNHPFIDVCCHGEGEATFLALLEAWPNNQWDAISGISYLDEKGAFHHHNKAPRRRDLSVLPSPYLTGCFEPLLQANPQLRWVASWETSRGCPFSCTFCDWGSAIQSKVFSFPMPVLLDELKWFGEHRIETIYCCDANFGILPRDEELAQAVAQVKAQTGYPIEFHQQSAKNVTERIYRIHLYLIRAGVIAEVTLALQSMSANTLHSIRRDNISLETYLELHRRLRQEDIVTYTDLILGLPGETYDSFADGVATVMAGGQLNRIQFYMASVLPNAEMADPAYQQTHGLVTTEIPIGPLMHESDIVEYLTVITATRDMPPTDWVKARCLTWMTTLLFFINKLLSIPLILLHHLGKVPFRTMIEAFLQAQTADFPLLGQINTAFRDKAMAIQRGEGEYCAPPNTTLWQDFQGKWLTPDTYLIIDMVLHEHMQLFYAESEQIIQQLRPATVPKKLISQAVALNQAMFHITFMCQPHHPVLPSHSQHLAIELDWNLIEMYHGLVQGHEVALCAVQQRYQKNWAGPPYVLQKYP